MADDVDLAYGTDGLRAGGDELGALAGPVGVAGATLRAADVEPIMFGRTPGAVVLATAVMAVRNAHAHGFDLERDRATELARRATGTAALGEQLVARSTVVASSAEPDRS